eukprot:CAMPEP_0198429614 /NCGR_PEP_ID=MMETSP1452-20131203/8510_1 /TAXON_ID=1181717 /ORGANISM="Synchroma pusillum, Strain CCMP3072" /LENGTH=32 /DNA_ID= /DNA_START= /DNA_END= /DNA_ORIENTATION=
MAGAWITTDAIRGGVAGSSCGDLRPMQGFRSV